MSEYYWWCPNCKQAIDPRCVTFEEYHEDCGHPVEWITAEASGLVDNLRAKLAAKDADIAQVTAEAAAMRCCANCDSFYGVNCELRPEEVCDNWRSDSTVGAVLLARIKRIEGDCAELAGECGEWRDRAKAAEVRIIEIKLEAKGALWQLEAFLDGVLDADRVTVNNEVMASLRKIVGEESA